MLVIKSEPITEGGDVDEERQASWKRLFKL